MSTWINEAGWDRLARILGGAVVLAVGYLAASGTVQTVFYVIGAMLLVTGITGFCPAYRLIGLNTCTLGKRAG